MPSFLPEELLVEIFSWLPVKSLVRFSCVSKSCKSLISDSEFVKLHLHRSSSTNSDIARVHLRICYDMDNFARLYISSCSVTSLLETTDSAIVPVPSCFSEYEYEFVGTCNGLICMRSPFDLDNVNQKHLCGFRFWNPATRSISPNSPPFYDGVVFGFAYDCSTDTYKVVGVDVTTVSIYNMGDNCQRTIQVAQLPPMDLVEPAVYVSNNLIWFAYLQEDETESTNTDLFTIASFLLIDLLRKETFGRDLIRLGATRFATSYLTLSCLSELETQLRALFDSEEWRSSKFAPSEEGKKVQKIVKDSQFWKNIAICLKAVGPLIEVLRLVDSEGTPAMGFIYDAIDTAKEKIRANFKDVKKRYESVWKIIDERWDKQLHRPLHAAGYYLNPHFHWDSNFRKDDVEVKEGLYSCLTKMVPNVVERRKIHTQLIEYHNKKGMFGLDDAQAVRKNLTPAEWWEAYGGRCPELMKFAIRVLSLTCSSSGCERNWSAFEMVHTKKRNRLHQKKMNDLVYVMYNLKLKNKPKKRNVVAPPSFEEIVLDNEWITEVEEDVNDNEEVGLEHLNDDDVNVDLGGVGSTSSSQAVHVNASGIRQDFSSDSDEGDDNDDGGESEDDDGDDHAMEE